MPSRKLPHQTRHLSKLTSQRKPDNNPPEITPVKEGENIQEVRLNVEVKRRMVIHKTDIIQDYDEQ